jgi:hypothetical protein
MSLVIHSYKLRITTMQEVALPEGAQILTVKVIDKTDLYLIVLIDTMNKRSNTTIHIYHNNERLPKHIKANMRYIGTVHAKITHDLLMLHVFEVVNNVV